MLFVAGARTDGAPMAKRLRCLLLAAVTFAAFATMGVGCSSERPSAASLDGDGGATREAGSGGDLSKDAEDPDADVDAASDGGDAGDGGTCLGDAPPDGGVGTCPASGPCSEPCGRILANYKGGVARAAVDCIVALPSCENAAVVVPCVDRALARACPEPTAPTYCSPLVTACDPNAGDAGSMISQAGCELFANGLSSAGRSAFEACIEDKIAQSTCPTEVGLCADEIRQ